MNGRRGKNPKRSLDPIVAQLRQIRIARRVTQEQVGNVINRCNVVIYEWEHGRNDPCLRNLHSWCFALGLRLVLEPIDSPVASRVLDQPGHAET